MLALQRSFRFPSLIFIYFVPANLIWNSKALPKVKAFAWLVANKKVNTSDKVHLRRRHKTLILDYCVMCLKSSESADHLFLHCPTTLALWQKSFCLANLDWFPPKGIVDMMGFSFEGFGTLLKGKILYP